MDTGAHQSNDVADLSSFPIPETVGLYSSGLDDEIQIGDFPSPPESTIEGIVSFVTLESEVSCITR